MRYEWKKLGRGILVLLLAAVVANAWLFYRHCTAPVDGARYTLLQVQEKMSWSTQELQEETDYLEERILSADPLDILSDESLLTGDVYDERRLNQAVLARKEFSYREHIERVLNDAEFRISSGLFGEQTGFAVRSMERIKAIYAPLANLPVQPVFCAGAETLTDWTLSDIFFLMFGFLPPLVLLIQERRNGLTSLLRPTKKGRGRLYLRKYAVAVSSVLAGFVLIYGGDLLISDVLFGGCDLSQPIQAVYGFESCPIPLTILGYSLLFSILKLLWGLTIATIIFSLCAMVSRISTVFLCVLGAGLLAVGMSLSTNLWLRAFSLVSLADTPLLLRQCLFVDFFDHPVRQLPVSVCFCGATTLICFAMGLFAFCRVPAVVSVAERQKLSFSFLHRHTSLFLHEGAKLWLTQGGLLLAAVFLTVQVISYHNYDKPNSAWDHYYQQYAQTLSGLPDSSKDTFLAAERARFADIHSQITQIYAAAGDDVGTAQLAAEKLQAKLNPEEAFEAAAAQYEALQAGQSFVYRSGYERLFGVFGRMEILLDTIKLLVFLVLILSGLFAIERESGMEIILTTSGARKKVRKRKLLHCGLITLLGFLLAVLPQLLAVIQNYGLPNMDALANSLPFFSAFPKGWTILGALIFCGAIRLALSGLSSAVITFLSYRLGNKVLTTLTATVSLVIPHMILLLIQYS